MLVQFSVKNYRSIRDTVTLDLSASALRERDSGLNTDNTFLATPKLSLTKSAVIYGANASGKSNILTALGFIRWMVKNSARESQAGDEIEAEPFLLDQEFEDKPSMFEIVFFAERVRYRYGFEVSKEAVIAEWLYHVPQEREALLYEREGQKFELSSRFREGKSLDEKTRKNALFLSVVAQFNGEVATRILNWFDSVGMVSGTQDLGYSAFTARRILDGSLGPAIQHLIQQFDIGITEFIVQDEEVLPNKYYSDLPSVIREALEKLAEENEGEFRQINVSAKHKKYAGDEHIGTVNLELEKHESEGTQKLFALAGPILASLQRGHILVIDEMDARLHPLITESIVTLFNSKETNSNNAQLIFATHDANLLNRNLFRRDQVWFTEKDPYGATDLYSLAEYKLPNKQKVRNDASYEKDYLEGRYGAIPFIGAMDFLMDLPYAEQEAQKSS